MRGMKKEPKKQNDKDLLGQIEKRFAHHLGLYKEHFDDKFSLMYEMLQGHIESNEKQFGEIIQNTEIIKGDIELIKYDLHTKVSYEEFVALEKKVLMLEKKK